jgi:hypothetical protein
MAKTEGMADTADSPRARLVTATELPGPRRDALTAWIALVRLTRRRRREEGPNLILDEGIYVALMELQARAVRQRLAN